MEYEIILEPGGYDGSPYLNEYVTRWNREHTEFSQHEFRWRRCRMRSIEANLSTTLYVQRIAVKRDLHSAAVARRRKGG